MVDPVDTVGLGLLVTKAIILVLGGIALYIYFALVFMTIAKKLEYGKPWLAWIPIASMFLFPILAKKHWAWGFIFFVPIVNIIFMIIWTWNIYEQRNYPGWLSLVPILALVPIRLIYIFLVIATLVIWGVVAWWDR